MSAIDRYRAIEKEINALASELAEGENSDGTDTHRPSGLVIWRNYHIGGSEIELRRDVLLREGKIKASTVEREYLRAKEDERRQIEAGIKWDKEHGLHETRVRLETLDDQSRAAAETLEKTVAMTVAGAGALLRYVLADWRYGVSGPAYWHHAALESVAASLGADT